MKFRSPISSLVAITACLFFQAGVEAQQFDFSVANEVGSVGMSPDGTKLAFVSGDNDIEHKSDRLILVDLQTEKTRSIPCRTSLGRGTRILFTADGKIAALTGVNLERYDFESGELIDTTPSISFLRQVGNVIAVLQSDKGAKEAVRFYDLASMKLLHDFGHSPQVRRPEEGTPCIDISPDGGFAAIVAGRAVRIVDLATGKESPKLECAEDIDGIALGPDGAVLAVALEDAKKYEIYDSSNPSKVAKLKGRISPTAKAPRGRSLYGLQFLDDKTIAVDTTTYIHAWDIETDKLLDTAPKGYSKGPDPRTVGTATVNLGQTAYRFDTATRKWLPGARSGLSGDSSKSKMSELFNIAHSADVATYAFKSSDHTISVRKVLNSNESLKPGLVMTVPRPTGVTTDGAWVVRLSDDGSLAYLFWTTEPCFVMGVFDRKNKTYLPIHDAKIPNVRNLREWGLPDNSCIDIRYFDSSKRQFSVLGYTEKSNGRRGGLSVENFWYQFDLDSKKWNVVRKWATPFYQTESNRRDVSRVFELPEKGLVVAVLMSVREADGTFDNHKCNLELRSVPTGRVVSTLAENLDLGTTGTLSFDQGLRVSADGTRLAMNYGPDDSVRLWNTVTGEEIKCLAEAKYDEAISFALGAKRLCVIKNDDLHTQSIDQTDLEEGNTLKLVTSATGAYSRIAAIAPSTPRYLTSCNGGRLEWRSLDDGSVVSEPQPLSGTLRSADISRDGNTLITFADDWSFQFWEIPEVTEAATSEVKQITIAPDGGR